jgi:hypothetical protein
MTTENYNKTIRFTEKGAITKIQDENTVTTENWVSSMAMTTIASKEFFIHDGITYYLTSRVVKEIN